MSEHIRLSNVDMTKVLELPKGINLTYFNFNSKDDIKYINAVVTRSLEPEYKHDCILKAFAILKSKNIPFKLTIIGDGSMLSSLENLTETLSIKNEVIFAGLLENEKVAEILQNSNFYISMPITEGVSASLFEAMACGCFPIVTDLPGNRSWIKNHENGILIPNENYKLLAKELIEATERSTWRKAVVERNRKFVEENANYAKNMKKIAEKYHDLINNKSKKKDNVRD